METRRFGRLGWQVSEIGCGMWGMAAWSGADETRAAEALDEAVRLGVNFFDTAWAYAAGRSERMLGDLVRRHPDRRLYTASKVPPKNGEWPSRRGVPLDEVFPPDHIRAYAERTLENLGLPRVDLLQFHVWEDAWARDDRWQRAMDDLRREGLVDAVQVIYNVFDQAPEDALFPLCEQLDVAVIARVPFDEGSLTGTLTKETRWPEGDWRNLYFVPENLGPTVDRVEALRPLVPGGMTMPELALRFILADRRVSTIIPGMSSVRHVRANVATSDGRAIPSALLDRLRAHRWDRTPTEWSH